MTAGELKKLVALEAGLAQAVVAQLLVALAKVAARELKDPGDFLDLPGLCRLKLKRTEAHTGRNPATGATVQVPARTAVKATVKSALKAAILGTAPSSTRATKKPPAPPRKKTKK